MPARIEQLKENLRPAAYNVEAQALHFTKTAKVLQQIVKSCNTHDPPLKALQKRPTTWDTTVLNL